MNVIPDEEKQSGDVHHQLGRQAIKAASAGQWSGVVPLALASGAGVFCFGAL